MPHRCTKCGTLFEDGDAVLLNGCPNCGWNKFLYVKKEGAVPESRPRPVLNEKKPELHSPLDEVVKNIDEALASEEAAHESRKAFPEASGKRSLAAVEDERVESVRILGPGSYELNLDSLFERDELVMALKEEGSYALHLPSVFKTQKENEKTKGKEKGKSKDKN